MRNILFGVALLAFVGLVLTIGAIALGGGTAAHEIEAAVFLVAFAVALSGAAIVEGLQRVFDRMDPEQKSEVSRQVKFLREELTERHAAEQADAERAA